MRQWAYLPKILKSSSHFRPHIQFWFTIYMLSNSSNQKYTSVHKHIYSFESCPHTQSLYIIMGKEASRKLEWRINVSDGVSERLEPETGAILRAWTWFKRLMLGGFILKICKFLEKAWNLAVDEPKKVIHGLKVGLAISLVSLFYYMRPLYDGVGGNAMWAVMTVVVVFESSVGQYSKSFHFCACCYIIILKLIINCAFFN